MKNFGLLTGFVGAITDTLQGFVLPPLMYAAAHKATIAPPKRAALLAMSVLGTLEGDWAFECRADAVILGLITSTLV